MNKMSSCPTNVGTNEHDEIWDDSLIIAAYDKALNLAKEKIARKNKDMESENDGPGTKQKSRLKNKTRDHKAKNRKWKVGDTCKAIFSEDGLLYPAIIESINTNAGTCVVKFVGYENEESVSIDSLIVSKNNQIKNNSKSETSSRSNLNSSPCSPWDNCGGQRFNDRFPPQWNADSSPFNASFHSQSSGLTNGTYPQFCMPPPHPGMGCLSACHSGLWNVPRCSGLPPLPPPPLPTLHPDSPDDVLASTLMSWYMSGYHTGFYQAMRRNKSKPHSRGTSQNSN